MKYFEKMNPVERQIKILKAVQGSASIEGMDKAADECRMKIENLRKKQQAQVFSTLRSKESAD